MEMTKWSSEDQNVFLDDQNGPFICIDLTKRITDKLELGCCGSQAY
jgi:hypothetical protein